MSVQYITYEIAYEIAQEIGAYFNRSCRNVSKSDLDFYFVYEPKVDFGGNSWDIALRVSQVGFCVFFSRRDISMVIDRTVSVTAYVLEEASVHKWLGEEELKEWLDFNEDFARFYRFVQELHDRYYDNMEA